MDELLTRLSKSVSSAQSLEQLARPLLDLLQTVTGFESTYLTQIDLEAGQLQVVFSQNSDSLQLPEGLSLPWADTLCKRALDEGRAVTDDVPAHWRDSGAAASLGIQSYASTPVIADGSVCGTLCAASVRRLGVAEDARALFQLFARLIGQQIERERLVARLMEANNRLAAQASTDPLTGLPNRRLLLSELGRMLARGQRERTYVLVAVIDLDEFKAINDTHGHVAGDRFLGSMAQRLQGALRATDLLARLGGDEFVALGPGPHLNEDADTAAHVWAERLTASTVGRIEAGDVAVEYSGASVGVVAIRPGQADAETALSLADAEMYATKRHRRAAPFGTDADRASSL